MKKSLMVVLALLLAMALAALAKADEAWADYTCTEGGFATKIPLSGSSGYEQNTGLVIYTDVPGYIPYVIVSRRPMDMKFNNPTNYLNNVYREYLENQHEDTGTNPAKIWEVGGKELIGARYMYHIGNYLVYHIQLIEIRDGGDVEYTAKYIEGAGEATLAALDTAVRYYHEIEEDQIVPAGVQDQLPASAEASSSTLLTPMLEPGAPVETENGTFWARVTDLDRIMNGGSFTVELYEQERFPAAQVEALKAGDRVRMNGTVYTVVSLDRPYWTDSDTLYALTTEEPVVGGYSIGFEKGDGDFYYGVIDNWRTTSYMTDVIVMMPLPYAFSFVYVISEDDVTIFDADKFVEFAKEGDEFVEDLGPESTVVQFTDGLLTMIVTQER